MLPGLSLLPLLRKCHRRNRKEACGQMCGPLCLRSLHPFKSQVWSLAIMRVCSLGIKETPDWALHLPTGMLGPRKGTETWNIREGLLLSGEAMSGMQ